ncbi:SitI3 family protein [Archangium sp.]|uniref:SitI3 family protein n=1 Tax=Archangium sp. TaxID=1872627 RepID=UPI00286B45C6|nr:SitI3 family protein [Archangium sp.]
MALEYDLEMVANINKIQALETLAKRITELQWSDDHSFLVDPTATITARASSASTQSLYKDTFHFVPTLGVGFRFVRHTDYDRFRQIMLQATILLLEHAQDAVLLFNGEIIVLQWFSGKLVFNSEYHIWDDDDWLRSRLALPFERRPLPSPLL